MQRGGRRTRRRRFWGDEHVGYQVAKSNGEMTIPDDVAEEGEDLSDLDRILADESRGAREDEEDVKESQRQRRADERSY